ncbi:MAG: 50S ribosomal protein L6 [Candidatus Saccharimonadales bacterium]
MSRVGKQPISIPSGVNVNVENSAVLVSGAKGNLSQPLLEGISVEVKDSIVSVSALGDDVKYRANHGLMRSLINNMIIGVSNGFSRKLEINGVGYRASMQGANSIKLSLGFSHDITFQLPENVNATIDQNIITISGADKQRVGQVASEIRELRKPEPYKGKGIKYEDEYIVRKSGKSGKEAK